MFSIFWGLCKLFGLRLYFNLRIVKYRQKDILLFEEDGGFGDWL